MTQQQDNLSKEEQLALKQARQVKQMTNSEGWAQVVRPYLMERLNQTFPDPSQFKEMSEYNYAAITASLFKKVIAELLGWIDAQNQVITTLEKKEKGEHAFNIGE